MRRREVLDSRHRLAHTAIGLLGRGKEAESGEDEDDEAAAGQGTVFFVYTGAAARPDQTRSPGKGAWVHGSARTHCRTTTLHTVRTDTATARARGEGAVWGGEREMRRSILQLRS